MAVSGKRRKYMKTRPGKGPPEGNTSGPFKGAEMGLDKGCCPTFEGALSWFLSEFTWQFLLFSILFIV